MPVCVCSWMLGTRQSVLHHCFRGTEFQSGRVLVDVFYARHDALVPACGKVTNECGIQIYTSLQFIIYCHVLNPYSINTAYLRP